MISKSQVKHIRSLDDKKMRYECKQFIIEGAKMISELLQSDFELISIYGTREWKAQQQLSDQHQEIYYEVNMSELSRISHLKTPNEVLAVVALPERSLIPQFTRAIALDHVQDPGNLGTIIRIADWYGISHIICSTHTVDAFNPKVLQATMGSIFRVQCHYTDLQSFFLQHALVNKYACVLNGTNVNDLEKMDEGIILLGNESKGIDEALLPMCDHKISIPRTGQAESLNVAVAAGIICNSLLR